MKKVSVFFLVAFLLLTTISFSVFAGGAVPSVVPGGAVPSVVPVVPVVQTQANAPSVPLEEPNLVPFTFVVAENDDFQPQNEYSLTFSKIITLNAESLKDAKINLTVSYGEDSVMLPKVYDEVIIGSSLKYIQPITLELGDNFITMDIEKDGYDKTTIEAFIKRKDGNILESLQNLIVIPGMMK